jgi:hypothetical protein
MMKMKIIQNSHIKEMTKEIILTSNHHIKDIEKDMERK